MVCGSSVRAQYCAYASPTSRSRHIQTQALVTPMGGWGVWGRSERCCGASSVRAQYCAYASPELRSEHIQTQALATPICGRGRGVHQNDSEPNKQFWLIWIFQLFQIFEVLEIFDLFVMLWTCWVFEVFEISGISEIFRISRTLGIFKTFEWLWIWLICWILKLFAIF